MNTDAKTYESAKSRNKLSVTKDPDNPTTAVIVTIDYYDKETGEVAPVQETINLEGLLSIRQKTEEELTRLDAMIVEIQTVLSGAK